MIINKLTRALFKSLRIIYIKKVELSQKLKVLILFDPILRWGCKIAPLCLFFLNRTKTIKAMSLKLYGTFLVSRGLEPSLIAFNHDLPEEILRFQNFLIENLYSQTCYEIM